MFLNRTREYDDVFVLPLRFCCFLLFWNVNLGAYTVCGAPCLDGYDATGCGELALDMLHSFGQAGGNGDLLITKGALGLSDAEDALKELSGTGAKHGVRVRVISAPILPQCACTAALHVEEGAKLL